MALTAIPYFWEKVISTTALLLVTVVFSYLPFVIKKRVRGAGLIMSYCNCLAGGIVLGAMLMHMIPEMMESAHCDHGHAHGSAGLAVMPAMGGVTDLGFVLEHGGHKHDHKHDHPHDHKNDKHAEEPKKDSEKTKKQDAHAHDDHQDGHSHGFAWGSFSAGCSFLLLFAIDRLFLTHSHCADAHPTQSSKTQKSAHTHEHGLHGCSHDHDHHQHHEDLSLQPDAEHGSCHEDDVIGGCHMDGINAAASKAQTFVFVLALSIHSFLEGMGMATKNTWNGLVSFLVSLFAHKWLEAFALGTGVAKACFPAWHSFWLIFVYAALTPAGIILGMWMDAASKSTSAFSHQLTRQVLDGLALGSFLFVSCIEMIPSEFHKKNKHAPFKFFVLCLGFVAMAVISIFHFH